MSLNKAILMGRLTREPELKTTASGVSVCSFTLAVARGYARDGGRETDFIDCVAWRSTAEFISRYFVKGQMMALVGSIQTRKWEDKDGNKRVSVEVVAEEASFCGERKEGGQARPEARPVAVDGPEAGGTEIPGDGNGFSDGDLPF